MIVNSSGLKIGVSRDWQNACVDHSEKLMQVLRELVASEFVSASAGAKPAQPLYSITESGTCLLEEAAGT